MNITCEIDCGTITVTGLIWISLKPIGFAYKSMFSK